MKKLLPILFLFLISYIKISAQTIPSYVPANGLIGWWPFNSNANDESGNGNHGKVNGATLTEDRNNLANNAYNFDGNSQSIQIPFTSKMSSKKISISFWVNIPQNYQGNNEFGFIVRSRFFGYEVIYLNSDKSLSFVLHHDYNNKSTQAKSIKQEYNDQKWRNVICTFDGTYNKLYIDGELVAIDTSDVNEIYYQSDGVISFGKDGNNPSPYTAHFNGKIDDVGIWDRALTETEINNLFKARGCSEAPKINEFHTCYNENKTYLELDNNPSFKWYLSNTGGLEIDKNKIATAGVYYVSQVVNGCESYMRSIVTVIKSPEIKSTFTKSDNKCFGEFKGQIITNVIGGTIPYSFEWSDVEIDKKNNQNQYGLKAGNYIFTVTDRYGCKEKNIVTITENQKIDLKASVTHQPTCLKNFGEITTISIQPVDNYQIKLLGYHPYAVFTQNKIYNLRTNQLYEAYVVNSNGCSSDTIDLAVNPGKDIPEKWKLEIINPNCKITKGSVIIKSPKGLDYTYYLNNNNVATRDTVFSGLEGVNKITVLSKDNCQRDTTITIINTTKNTPVADISQIICAVDNKQLKDIKFSAPQNNQNGAFIFRYKFDPASLPTSTSIKDTTYIVKYNDGQCESDEILLTIKTNKGGDVQNGSFNSCAIEEPLVGQLIPNENNITWYSTVNSSIKLDKLTTKLSNGVYYYSSKNALGCESVTRGEVVVTLNKGSNPFPSLNPALVVPFEFCLSANPQIADLSSKIESQLTGQNVFANKMVWYLSATDKVAYNGKLDDLKSYFVTYVDASSCESIYRFEVPVKLINFQGVSTMDLEQTFCKENTNVINDVDFTPNIYSDFVIKNELGELVTDKYQKLTTQFYELRLIDKSNLLNCVSSKPSKLKISISESNLIKVQPIASLILKNSNEILLTATPKGGTFSGEGVKGNYFYPYQCKLGTKKITYNYKTQNSKCDGSASIITIIVDSTENKCHIYDTVKVTKYDTIKTFTSVTDTLKIKLKLTTGTFSKQYNNIKIYPNPTISDVMIDYGNYKTMQGYYLTISDISGKKLNVFPIDQQITKINLSSFGGPGIYFFNFHDINSNIIETKKIVLE